LDDLVEVAAEPIRHVFGLGKPYWSNTIANESADAYLFLDQSSHHLELRLPHPGIRDRSPSSWTEKFSLCVKNGPAKHRKQVHRTVIPKTYASVITVLLFRVEAMMQNSEAALG
jgi:hypothetical protein